MSGLAYDGGLYRWRHEHQYRQTPPEPNLTPLILVLLVLAGVLVWIM